MSEKEFSFKIDDQNYLIKWIDEYHALETIPMGSVKDVNLLGYLSIQNDLLIPLNIKMENQEWVFSYQTKERYHNFKEVSRNLSESEKIKLCINLLDILQLSKTRINPVVHPDNVFFDINLRPKIIHRGVEGVLYPEKSDNLFKQIKAFIIMALSGRYSFERLYKGVMSEKSLTSMTYKKIAGYSSVSDLRNYLKKLYDSTLNNEHTKLITISKKKFGIYHWGFLISSIAAAFLVVVVGYVFLIMVPHNNTLIDGTGDYLSQEYDRTISDLSTIKIDKMPKAYQLMLAEAYVNVDNLNHTQKENVKKSLNMHSDPNYLKYWIYDGKGDFDKSLDIAKYLGDNQLILFSYTKLYSQANNNPQLSGSKKQELLSKYSKLIKDYSKKLKKEQAKQP
ncbi:type VII secretion protein EssB [Xylocopilactobacillus apicola]|uniref:Type VII secretion protein EssB n=1 Tax=Xylocopilactobacillus apicola TaxID=2932184 RepID=A0AAU9DHG9_9LACO|nr:type VII secretion protein EssB [Xylocopilactobacillus apicola]BDR59445.1 type VII secretion protein EssB [Xylocopilactobacillus apicola]